MTIDPGAIPNFGPQQPPQGPPPIIKPDAALIGDLFEQVGIKYGTDEEGDTVASWPGFRVYAMFRGDNKELFAVRAFYDRAYPLEEKQELLDLIDGWNRDSLWPKVYTHTNEEGVLRLVGEQQMVIPQGVNVDYFVASTMNWVQASIGFNTWLAERLGLEVEVDSVGQSDNGGDDDADGSGENGGNGDNSENDD